MAQQQGKNIKEALTERSPEHQKQAHYWHLLLAMVEGGSELTEDLRYQLLATPYEKEWSTAAYRLKVARYENIMGSLISIMQSQIMATPASFNNPNSNDPFWQEEFLPHGCFISTKQGSIQVSFMQMLSYACLYSLSQGMCYAIVEQDPDSGRPFVNLMARPSLFDWSTEMGEMNFAKFFNQRIYKPTWDAYARLQYQFIIYQKDPQSGKYYAQLFILEKEIKSESDYNFPKTPEELNSFELFTKTEPQEMYNATINDTLIAPSPVVPLSFQPPLWLADRLYDAQRSHFNQINGVEWGLLSTNFSLLTFKDVEDSEQLKVRFKQAGDGYYLDLPVGVEPMWLERSPDGIQLGIDYSEKVKTSMFDTISLIAKGNAPSQMRQSAESKVEDRRNLQILLQTYGRLMKDFATEILDTASIANGDDPGWVVSGFEGYNVDQLLKDLEEYRQSEELIVSPTFSREGQKSIALKASEAIGIPRKYWQEIIDEIDVAASTLSDKQLETLTQLTLAGLIDLGVALQTMVDAQALPPDFPVEESLLRLGAGVNTPLDLSNPQEQE